MLEYSGGLKSPLAEEKNMTKLCSRQARVRRNKAGRRGSFAQKELFGSTGKKGKGGKGKNVSESTKVSFGKWAKEAATTADEAATAAEEAATAADEAATAADESCECKPPAVTYPLRGRSQDGEGSTPADEAAKAADDGLCLGAQNAAQIPTSSFPENRKRCERRNR